MVEPFAALFNHSCTPNAATDFDRGKVWVRAVRDIAKGEQIFVSYIETINQYSQRQSELLKRYYFTCRCSKCEKEKNTSSLGDDTDPETEAITNAQREALELLDDAKSVKFHSSKIPKYRSAMSILRKAQWPLFKQPYARLRNELITSLLFSKEPRAAFVQSAILHLRVDPVTYHDRWHPISSLNKWVFVRLMRHLSQQGDLGTAEGVNLSKYNLNLFILIYSVLLDLETTASHELPTVEDIIRDALADFQRAEWSYEDMKPQIDAEWAKLEKLVNEAVQIDEAYL